jgi:hypothetical protein
MKTFVETVQAYSAWKLNESGNAKLSREEILALREEYQKEVKALREKTGKQLPKQLKEACDKFLAWKKENNKGDKITETEVEKIKETLKEQNKKDFNLYVSNYKKFKEEAGQGSTLTEKEIKMLKENFKESLKTGVKLDECTENFDAKKALKEADMGMAPPAPAAGDPNAMAGGDPNMAMDPMAGAPADPMALQGAVDAALAALQPVATGAGNAMGADPNAGLPPVTDGAAAAGPAPGAPGLMEATAAFIEWKKANGKGETLTESEKKILQEKYGTKEKSEYEKIQERISEREAKIKALQEGYALPGTSVADAQKKADAGKGLPTPGENSRAGGYDTGSISTTPEQVKVPTPQQLANGYSSGAGAKETDPANTWPTKATDPKTTGGALQGKSATQSKIKEEDETQGQQPAEEQELQEGTTVTDIYVQRSLEPKLDFKQIRESMKSGLLG